MGRGLRYATSEDYDLQMTRWTFALVLLAALSMTGFASAAEKIMVRRDSQKTENGTISSVNFADASCEEECQIATLVCAEWGAISLTLADIDAKIAAKAITLEKQQIVLQVEDKAFDYAITEMDYMEMTGSWWLTAITIDVKARELAPAIAAAKVLEAHVGETKVMLPVNADVKAWATDCK